jgi:hypothetical protein
MKTLWLFSQIAFQHPEHLPIKLDVINPASTYRMSLPTHKQDTRL